MYLVIAADEVHRLGVLDFERQQKADGLKGMGPPVHIVSQKEVVYVGDVSSRRWGPVLVKEPHQVQELTVQVTKDLHRRCRCKTGIS